MTCECYNALQVCLLGSLCGLSFHWEETMRLSPSLCFIVASLTTQPSYLQRWLTERTVAAVQNVTGRVSLQAHSILHTGSYAG